MLGVIINGIDIQKKVKPGTLLAHIADKQYNPNTCALDSLVDYFCIYNGKCTYKERERDAKEEWKFEQCCYDEVTKEMREKFIKEEMERRKKYSRASIVCTGKWWIPMHNKHIDFNDEGFFYIINEEDKKEIISTINKIMKIINEDE